MPLYRDTSYPTIRQNLDADYQDLADSAIESIFQRQGMDAEAMEGFFSDLGKFASSAGGALLKAAPSILPVAGSVIGTAFGGPIGASLGGSLGSLAGKALGAATGTPTGAPSGGAAGAGGIAGLIPGVGGSAAGQLLNTLVQPSTMQALMSMAMGPAGRDKQIVAGAAVPNSAFSSLLGMLANRASAEANAMAAGDSIPSYMRNAQGESVGDASVAENRAAALLELLEAERSMRDAGEAAEAIGESEAYEATEAESEMEAIDAEYDALDLADLYELESADSERE